MTTAIRNDIYVKQSILAEEDVGELDSFDEIINPLTDEKKFYWQARITELEVLIKHLETGRFVVDAEQRECPDVYIVADGMTEPKPKRSDAYLLFTREV